MAPGPPPPDANLLLSRIEPMTTSVARPASTVVLARPAAIGLEVFLVRRHDRVAFMGGAHVFPGGRVDAGDRLDEPTAWCDGVDGAVARLHDVPPGDALAFYVAAARELFEEAGVLLARGADGEIVALDEATSTAEMQLSPDAAGTARPVPLTTYRAALDSRTLTIGDLLQREQLRLALDRLALFGHWVTPEGESARFDTYFFLAVAPDRQAAAHDERETTHGTWLAPSAALDRCRRGEIALPPPTWTTLRMLEAASSPETAWQQALARPVPLVRPRFVEQADGSRLITLPGDADYPAIAGFAAAETRFLLKDGRWTALTTAAS
jgi:8-oxo-dGTP pyrophosphatase MutT (NUDIX family)